MKRTSVDVVRDATRESLLELGVRRTTFAEVARRAGVSRATLYTHHPDVRAAIADVLTTDLGALLRRAATAPPGGQGTGHARARLVATVRRVMAELATDPLLQKVLAVDAEVLLPYLVQRFGAVQRLALDLLTDLVRAGQADGSVRDGEAGALATATALAVQSAVLARDVVDLAPAQATDLADVHDALLRIIDRGLAPT